ncbi:hypothetical protein [uncultured Paracoccus sp.]|uniref:hypothetical protein n=1 Tax=uncultured Paracoccus sp. TaxID=189685 RepID=UPI002637EAD0|nr:hypothetical protein [uncultured Paracoccus sp.]
MFRSAFLAALAVCLILYPIVCAAAAGAARPTYEAVSRLQGQLSRLSTAEIKGRLVSDELCTAEGVDCTGLTAAQIHQVAVDFLAARKEAWDDFCAGLNLLLQFILVIVTIAVSNRAIRTGRLRRNRGGAETCRLAPVPSPARHCRADELTTPDH